MLSKRVKTSEERVLIVQDVLSKLQNQGLDSQEYAAVQQLKGILNLYIQTPDDQSGYSGKIKFPEIDGEFEYVLPMRSATQAYVRLHKYGQSNTSKGQRKQRKLTKAQQEAQQSSKTT
jgi:3-deoxy-D-arabino-heptulosonate 7-phosphate (DAHP) synthase